MPFQELISAKDVAAANEEQLSAELSTVSVMTTFGMHDPSSPKISICSFLIWL